MSLRDQIGGLELSDFAGLVRILRDISDRLDRLEVDNARYGPVIRGHTKIGSSPSYVKPVFRGVDGYSSEVE